MTTRMKNSDAQLQGDLTDSGVTHSSIDSLAVSLQKIDLGGKKNIRIDCGKVRSADISGLQLLYVWMQCFRFRGVEPELVNLSASLKHAIQKMSIGHCFTISCAHP